MLEREWKAQCLEYLGNAPEGQGETQPQAQKPPAYNLIMPRSRCPSCGHKIAALENIPVLSYLVLRGRCASCKTHISMRYPIVEGLTGVLSGYIAWRFGFTLAAGFALIFCWSLVPMFSEQRGEIAMLCANTSPLTPGRPAPIRSTTSAHTVAHRSSEAIR